MSPCHPFGSFAMRRGDFSIGSESTNEVRLPPATLIKVEGTRKQAPTIRAASTPESRGTRKQAPTIRAASTPESSGAARLRLSNTEARCWICFRVPRRMERETFHSPQASREKIPAPFERAHPPAGNREPKSLTLDFLMMKEAKAHHPHPKKRPAAEKV